MLESQQRDSTTTHHPAALVPPDANQRHLHLVDAETIAAQYGLRPSYVYKLAREGRMPSYKIGRLVRFDVGEVEDCFRNFN